MISMLGYSRKFPKIRLRVFALIGSVSILLSGCVAAPYVAMYALSAAGTGLFVYQQYRLSTGGDAEFKVEKVTPSEASRKMISKARVLVVYPHNDGFDGAGVDVLREKTRMRIVSSTEAIKWVNENVAVAVRSMPKDEKYNAVKRLALATGADLGLLVEAKDPQTSVTPIVGTVNLTIDITSTLIRAQTGAILWQEKQELAVASGGGTPPTDELNTIVAKGIADRLIELRSGG